MLDFESFGSIFDFLSQLSAQFANNFNAESSYHYNKLIGMTVCSLTNMLVIPQGLYALCGSYGQ